MPSTLAQSKERKASNFAIWQPCSKVELNLVGYTCEMADSIISVDNGTIVKRRTGAYSESATLFFGTGEQGRVPTVPPRISIGISASDGTH